MSEIVERVARALFEDEGAIYYHDGKKVDWPGAIVNCPGRVKRQRRRARVAIAAMRDMIDAALSD